MSEFCGAASRTATHHAPGIGAAAELGPADHTRTVIDFGRRMAVVFLGSPITCLRAVFCYVGNRLFYISVGTTRNTLNDCSASLMRFCDQVDHRGVFCGVANGTQYLDVGSVKGQRTINATRDSMMAVQIV